MVELHSHSIISDGELTPSELVRLACSMGYKGVVITDHVDTTNIYHVCKMMKGGIDKLSQNSPIPVLWGVEITHVPPGIIKDIVKEARREGAKLVIGHGETITEPVCEGTNKAFIEAGVDILAHPGLISEEEVREASERGVFLEITTRKGHSYTNGHVVRLGKAFGARFVICNDTHTYGDMLSVDMVSKILIGAGLDEKESGMVLEESEKLFKRLLV